jgi:hypothetical protein
MPAPRARRRDRSLGAGMATPLAATFLGLLVVHSLRPADAAESGAADDPGGGPGGEAMPGGPVAGAGPLQSSMGGVAPTAASVLIPGSVLEAGAVIDPAALTRLSGSARFAELTPPTVGAGGVASPALPDGPSAPAPLDLSPPDATPSLVLPSLPAAETSGGSTDDADLANLGAYQRGSDVDQTVVLTPKDDVFLGGEGDEHVLGLGGDDQLSGGGGDDVLEGGDGDDALEGGSGDDTLEGGSGDDALAGGSGDDTLTGGSGSDRLDGETGDDVLVLDDPTDVVKELGLGADSGGDDTIVVKESYAQGLAKALPALSPDGRATLVLGTPDPASFPQGLPSYRQQIDPDIEHVRLEGSAPHAIVGSDAANILEGNLGANRIYGGSGDDRIHGDGGADWLEGNEGDDWLEGGDGADTLYGGDGDDVFVLGLQESGDHIFDFQGQNRLHLSIPDPEAVGAELQGGDLLIKIGNLTVATVHDYAEHADNFAGIDLGEGVRPIADLLDRPEPAAASAEADWLAAFMPSSEETGPAPLADPWSFTEAGLAEADAAAPGEQGELAAASSAAGAASASSPDFTIPDLSGGDLWLPIDPVTAAPFETAGLDASVEASAETRLDAERQPVS